MLRDVLVVAAFLFPVGLAVAWLIVRLGWVKGIGKADSTGDSASDAL